MLKACSEPLSSSYDLALLDLDGVVYIGAHAVPGAARHLAAAASAGMHLAFVTNNAARPPRDVAAHLRELGVPAGDTDVVTSAQAAARMLAERLPAGAAVFVIGGTGLLEALAEEGLVGVQDPDAKPVAVVSGYFPDLTWRTVTDGAILVQSGLPWVASNLDYSVPTPRGRGPGNGVLVEVVSRFTGRVPDVAGKPLSPLFEETLRRVGGRRPLVVGDRLDTDIEGAHNAGLDSLLVLTGVTGLSELLAAAPAARPSYVARDLAGLGTAHGAPSAGPEADTLELGGWRAAVEDDALVVGGQGSPDDWWRVVACAGWAHLDRTGQCVATTGLQPPG